MISLAPIVNLRQIPAWYSATRGEVRIQHSSLAFIQINASNTWNSQAVSQLSTILALCCLTPCLVEITSSYWQLKLINIWAPCWRLVLTLKSCLVPCFNTQPSLHCGQNCAAIGELHHTQEMDQPIWWILIKYRGLCLKVMSNKWHDSLQIWPMNWRNLWKWGM